MPKPRDGSRDEFIPNEVEQLARSFRKKTKRKKKVKRAIKKSEPPVIRSAKKISCPKLGEDAYHGVTGQLLRSLAPYTEATDPGILAHFLGAVATIIGPGPYVFAGSKQYARINSVVVGPTNSGRKGTALAPVDMLFSIVDKKFWARQRVGGLSSGEGLIERLKDEEDEDGQPIITEKRTYVVEEEYSRVLRSISREGNVLSEVIRQAFDSGNLSTLTVKPRMAFGAHVCIISHITPEELEERVDHIELVNGFMNRFLIFLVQSDKLIARPVPFPDDLFDPFLEPLRRLRKAPSRSVELSKEAGDLWETIYPGLREDRPGLVGAATARGPAIVLRIALIYALLDGKADILPEHLKAAMAVWDYNSASAEALFHSETGDKLGDKILKLLADGPMTKKEFNRHLSISQKRQFESAMKRLEADKYVKQEKVRQEGAGRPATRWSRL